jgi:hypothetical protein
VKEIAELGDGQTWHPFGYANFLELVKIQMSLYACSTIFSCALGVTR